MVETLSKKDTYIGKRLRERRKLLGYNPDEFAAKIGVSKQQLQKYETGVNRISAAMLDKCAHELNVELTFFVSDIPMIGISKTDLSSRAALLEEPDTKKLIKNYIAISDTRVRLSLVELITSIRKSNVG